MRSFVFVNLEIIEYTGQRTVRITGFAHAMCLISGACLATRGGLTLSEEGQCAQCVCKADDRQHPGAPEQREPKQAAIEAARSPSHQ